MPFVRRPGFVIEFILDRTLTPALDTFGLETVRLIDPACGSGHFLLAALARLFRLWQAREPTTNPPVLAQRALDAIYGVDLNPFAIEITRFRLLIAALECSGIERLRDAPNFHMQVAIGDSLLHGSRPRDVGGVQTGLYDESVQFFYETEDADEVKRMLSQTYHAVVGNPPYINVDDPVLREAYRERFTTCYGQYQLGVPFTERFFDLTVFSDEPRRKPAGWIGMIVSNAFMKRTFGKKLIEGYLRNRDLTHVIDTSGVYLPGHGTPTTILLGRHQRPLSGTIKIVRGIRGERGVPDDPPNAPVWREIADHFDQPYFDGQRVSIQNAPRTSLANHPWPMGGGGAAELKQRLDEARVQSLEDATADIGVIGRSSADDAFVASFGRFRARSVSPRLTCALGTGDALREWHVGNLGAVLFPYLVGGEDPLSDTGFRSWLWPLRTALGSRATFSQRTYFQEGRPWWGWHQLSPQRLTPPLTIAYGEISTQNHFVLDRGGKVFNQTAPVIKLAVGATEEQHLELLGLLNSSAACFWLKQVCFPKGGDHVGTEGARVTKVQWEERYAFDSTKLKQFPVPAEKPLELTKLIQAEVDARSALLPEKICAAGVPTRNALDDARNQTNRQLARMIALQEELDWRCYRLYGIIEEDLAAPADRLPPLELGQRTFEIRMAREMHEGELETTWFERHRSRPITEFPAHWPEDYRQICLKRMEVAQSNRDIGLIEQPEYKRRWNLPTWEEMERAALKNWLLDRMEANAIWREHVAVSCGRLRDVLAQDPDWISVAAIHSGGEVEHLDELVTELALDEAVPFLPALRYTETGLRKRAEWEQVWELQRREDRGEPVEIPVPPKYRSNDFRKSGYWRLRGGLDVPKERFILYPGFERDADRTPVLGWAGWNHLEQARALAGYYQRMKTEEGWEPERLKPILAGLLDLKPWLLQWHNDLDPEMGEKLGEYFVKFAEAQCQELGFTIGEILAWRSTGATGQARRTRRRRTA
jgi:hypothetical protein